MHELLADAVLVLHVAFVVFVIAGLPLMWWVRRRRWVDGLPFRLAHGAAIVFVVAQAWLGVDCPLTTLESWLRIHGGGGGYARSFIGHWLQRLLFYDAPTWAFTLAYSAFGVAVALTWWRRPPRRGGSRDEAVTQK